MKFATSGLEMRYGIDANLVASPLKWLVMSQGERNINFMKMREEELDRSRHLGVVEDWCDRRGGE